MSRGSNFGKMFTGASKQSNTRSMKNMGRARNLASSRGIPMAKVNRPMPKQNRA
jgi:hypothetical protein